MTKQFQFSIIIILAGYFVSCSILGSENSNNEDPGPIASPAEVNIKELDRKDYFVCCGDTLTSRNEFIYDDQIRLTRYAFYNSEDINTLFNTYHYIDGDKKADFSKHFITQTDTGVPGLTDSLRYSYNASRQLIEITRYTAPNDSLISLSSSFSYDKNGRLITIIRHGNEKSDYFYNAKGNMVRKEKSFINQDTGEFEVTFIQTTQYGKFKNPFFRKQLTGVIFNIDLDRSLSPNAPIEFNNFNMETSDPIANGSFEYKVNEKGFPIWSKLIFKNLDGISQGTVVETKFEYTNHN